MLPARVTMKDVASEAGVHQTTVSLALRGDPRLPEKTRLRIRAVAERLGYQPDPMLSALNFYRSARRPVRVSLTLGFLFNFEDRAEMERSYPHRMFLEGAQRQAEALGYGLDVLFVGRGRESHRRHERILKARGVAGVILASFADKPEDFGLGLESFSAVLIESRHLGLALHTISNNQQGLTREAVRRLRDLGYRRIGLAVGANNESTLRNAFSAGYMVEVAQHPDLVAVPALLLTPVPVDRVAAQVSAWVRRHRIDAVITNWLSVPAALATAGLRVPGDVAVAALDLTPGEGPRSGMRQNHRIVGARAVDQLALMIRTHQRGRIELPNWTLIEGTWVDGPDLPPRKKGRGDTPS